MTQPIFALGNAANQVRCHFRWLRYSAEKVNGSVSREESGNDYLSARLPFPPTPGHSAAECGNGFRVMPQFIWPALRVQSERATAALAVTGRPTSRLPPQRDHNQRTWNVTILLLNVSFSCPRGRSLSPSFTP